MNNEEDKDMKIGRQWEDRFELWDEAFAPNLYHKTGRIDMEGFTTMEHLGLKEAKEQSYQPYLEGTEWGKKWEYG